MRKHFLLLFFLCMVIACGALADTGTEICMEQFMQNAHADGTPTVLYTGVTKIALNMRSQADKDSASLGTLKENETVQIFGFDQEWLFCWRSDVGTYFIGRHNVDNITPVSDDIAPYGVIRNTYVAITAVDTALYASADENAEKLVSIAADSRLSAWLIQDGWAVVPYKRVIGYLYVGDIKQLEPVAAQSRLRSGRRHYLCFHHVLFSAQHRIESGAHGKYPRRLQLYQRLLRGGICFRF